MSRSAASDGRPLGVRAARFTGPNPEAMSAGITAFVWYAFGAVPLLLAVARTLGLSPAQTSSWLFVVWFGGGVSSVALSLWYRQPIPIASTVPGLLYLGTLAGRFSFEEIVAANFLAGVLILACGVLRVGTLVAQVVPLPVVLGMFGGSLIGYVTGAVKATVADPLVGGLTVAGYVVGRTIGTPSVPPMALALLSGGVASLARVAGPVPLTFAPPALVVPDMHLSLHASFAVTLPMVVLSLGIGNVQGIGFLMAQGYRVAVDKVTVVVGINSVVNALFGGHPAIVARTGVAVVAGPDAGPPEGRYWASVIASSLAALVASAATVLAAIVDAVPASYLAAIAGLAILSTFEQAVERAFNSALRFGGVVAFATAATSFELAGITSAFWAIVAGLTASLLVERAALLAVWHNEARAHVDQGAGSPR